MAQFTCSSQKLDFSRHGKPVYFFFQLTKAGVAAGTTKLQKAHSQLLFWRMWMDLLCAIWYINLIYNTVAQVIRYIFINIPVNNKTHTSETGDISWVYLSNITERTKSGKEWYMQHNWFCEKQ